METLNGTKVFAGPYVGEFGWELFCFQGHLRWLATNRGCQIIASARPGHEALYEDFAVDFVPFNPPEGQPDGWRIHGYDREAFAGIVPRGMKWLNPWDIKFQWRGPPVVDDQIFIPYGNPVSSDQMVYDVLIHARARQTCAARNWPREKWLELISQLPSSWSVGWIGTKKEAMGHGSNDLRGLPLKQLIQEIRKARLVVGPSSGPMHLASLCRTSHVVWSGNKRDVPRYAKVWNPFDVQQRMIQTWQPDVGAVIAEIRHFLP